MGHWFFFSIFMNILWNSEISLHSERIQVCILSLFRRTAAATGDPFRACVVVVSGLCLLPRRIFRWRSTNLVVAATLNESQRTQSLFPSIVSLHLILPLSESFPFYIHIYIYVFFLRVDGVQRSLKIVIWIQSSLLGDSLEEPFKTKIPKASSRGYQNRNHTSVRRWGIGPVGLKKSIKWYNWHKKWDPKCVSDLI